MIKGRKKINLRASKGQSLVEVAIFMPILIFILLGIVEVTNLLNTQNKVTTASRMAAGFGASNFDENNWAQLAPGTNKCVDGTACAMGQVARNTVTETLELTENLWDVWSIWALTNQTGTDFDVFTYTHVYGNHSVITLSQWNTIKNQVRSDMLSDIQSWPDGAANLEVVASVPYHDIDTILGLPLWQWSGLQTIRGLTVMRVGERKAFEGCPLLPINVRLNQHSVYPSDWPWPNQQYLSGYPGPTELFVEEIPQDKDTQWQYPEPAPTYSTTAYTTTNGTGDVLYLINPTLSNYPNNIPGISLKTAIEGDSAYSGLLFLAREEGPSGSFGWLDWDGQASGLSAQDLLDSLVWPGNFLQKYPKSEADTPTTMLMGGNMACIDGDMGDGFCNGRLVPTEWVQTSTGNVLAAKVQDQLQCYVDGATTVKGKGPSCANEINPSDFLRDVAIIVFDKTDKKGGGGGEPSGSTTWFRVYAIVKARLVGYKFDTQPENRWILFEYLGIADNCYQE